MDDTKRWTLIRQIAGGKRSSPRSIRDAAIRLMTGYSDGEDERMVNEYLESMYDT